MMYLRYTLQVTLWLMAVLGGILGGYFLARYAHIGEAIWGNAVDGYDGDFPYRDNEARAFFRRIWPDFWWSCIRNPANNLARSFSAKGKVLSIEQKGKLKIVEMYDGKQYFFYFSPHSKLMLKLGWKLWDSTTVKHMNTNAKLAFSLQKGRGK